MASWQAKVLNSILSYIAKPGMNARGVRMSLADIRVRLLTLDCRYLPWPEDLVTEALSLSHSQLLHYRLAGNPQKGAEHTAKPALFYVRGGGFCFKTPHAHGRYIATLCGQLGAEAFVPDYRLAPEYPFPAPFEDVLEGFSAFLDRWQGPFVIMGDSAGGNLGMALLLKARDLGLRLPQSCVLLSPALDLAITGDSERLLSADDPFFTPESLLRLRGAYLRGANPMMPEVSPLHGDLHGLPPVLLLAGRRELLLEDSERMAVRLAAAGNLVESHFIANMPHVFPLFELVPEAKEGRQIVVDFIHRYLR
ncbi:alpha/beta hydrolase [Shewanella sp.]|uniref:alpha/beta hydrolase n=1 Tax=Shewanella sp. TaxID=50422 RepID=UPI00356A4A10